MEILLIEDSEKTAVLVKKILETTGNEVDVEYTGKDGLQTALKTRPELILLDINLPDISGIKICKKLKKNKKTKDIPVFMVTSNSKMKDIEKAFNYGADDYIAKPLTMNTLWSQIQYKLEKLENEEEE